MLSNADSQSGDALLPTPQCAWARYPPASVSLRTVVWIAAVLPARRRGVRWPHAPAAHAQSPLSCPPGLPFFSDQILQHRDVQCLLGNDALQLRILFLQLLQAFGFAHIHPAVLTAPSVERSRADPMVSA